MVPVDTDGSSTILFLRRTKKLASLMSNLSDTDHSHSLDIHPFVYLYSKQGHHQPTMFLAVADWLHSYDRAKRIPDLAKPGVREEVEDFLLRNAFLIQAISRRARREEKAVRSLKRYLDFLTDHLLKNGSDAGLLELVGKQFKVSTTPEPDEDEDSLPGSRIPITVKNSLFIDQELENGAKRCSVCGARIPPRGWSVDHRTDRKHGGTGAKANASPTHHACNSAKDKITKTRAKAV
jgi:hypothetical protein